MIATRWAHPGCLIVNNARTHSPIWFQSIAIFLAVSVCNVHCAHGATKGALLTSFNFSASQFELDATNHRLYASVPALNSVAIIDTQTLSLVDTVFVGSNPFGLGLSEDGSRLYIGNRGSTANAITAFDTQLLSVVGNFSLPLPPIDIAVGRDNRVYASPLEAATLHGIMQIDGLTGQFLGEFAPRHIYIGGLLEITADRQTLIEQELGSSPSRAFVFDVSAGTGTLQHTIETGSNGQDLAVSHSGNYFAAPNGAPYDIRLFRTNDVAVLGTLMTGPYPREITFSPDDSLAYPHISYIRKAKLMYSRRIRFYRRVPF
jgi:YVTN family beta-propeller protein